MNAKSRGFRICLLAISALLAPAIARAQDDVLPPRTAPGSPTSGTGSITGKVVLPSGQPVSERIRIILSTMTNPGMVVYTDTSGGFGFRSLAEGLYTIEVSGDTRLYEIVTQEVRLIRGMHVRLLINLKEKASLDASKPAARPVSAGELEQNVPAAAKKEFDAGSRLAGEGKIKEAVERFKAAIAIHPGYVMARNDLGAQYLKLKLFAEATEQFEAAVELNPKAFNPRLNIGIALTEQKRFSAALEHLNVALSINSAAPAVHLYLGIVLGETDELSPAERELLTAMSIGGPEYALAHFYLAQVYLKQGEREPAMRELSAFLSASPSGDKAARAKELLAMLKSGKI
ncbi:MAG TPA: tetratricopeptide repeat protein [Blastocatellia bacterium]|nr:tetratricopeptide repeat protein [Blastocatellia bacterium]